MPLSSRVFGASLPRPPGLPAAACQPASWQLPKVCCLGLFVCLQPRAETYFCAAARLRHPTICSVLPADAAHACFCSARQGPRAGFLTPCQPPRRPVTVEVTTCSPTLAPGPDGGWNQGSKGKATSWSEPCGLARSLGQAGHAQESPHQARKPGGALSQAGPSLSPVSAGSSLAGGGPWLQEPGGAARESGLRLAAPRPLV